MANENAVMQARIEALERQIAQLTGRVPRPKEIPQTERADYIEVGSERHVAWLGLREATSQEIAVAEKREAANEVGLVYESHDGTAYVLQDITAFGITVEAAVLKAILMQKVHELAPTPALQSDDPTAPNYAPSIWVPEGVPV